MQPDESNFGFASEVLLLLLVCLFVKTSKNKFRQIVSHIHPCVSTIARVLIPIIKVITDCRYIQRR